MHQYSDIFPLNCKIILNIYGFYVYSVRLQLIITKCVYKLLLTQTNKVLENSVIGQEHSSKF